MKVGAPCRKHPGMFMAPENRVPPGEVAVKFDANGKRYLALCVCRPGDPYCCHDHFAPGDHFCRACRGWVGGPGPGGERKPVRHFCIATPPDLVTPPRPLRSSTPNAGEGK